MAVPKSYSKVTPVVVTQLSATGALPLAATKAEQSQ
jgi:hypothetical protein